MTQLSKAHKFCNRVTFYMEGASNPLYGRTKRDA